MNQVWILLHQNKGIISPLEIWLVEQFERIDNARDEGEIGCSVYSDSLAHDGPEELEVLQDGLVSILTVQLLDESLKLSTPLTTLRHFNTDH